MRKNLVIAFILCLGFAFSVTNAQVKFPGGGANFPLLASSTDNSATTPQYSFASGSNIGMFYNFGNIAFSIAGSRVVELGATTIDHLSDSAQIRLGAGNDMVFSRRAANEFGLSNVLFAALGTPANGTFAYCSDCTIASPCASGGTGAFAKRLNGVWVCN